MDIEAQRIFFRVFAESTDGQILDRQIRYGKFYRESFGKKNWIKLLGADVNNLEHLRQSLGVMRWSLSVAQHYESNCPGRFVAYTRDQANLTLWFMVVHDVAEAKVGDIPYGQKTENDEIIEHEQLVAMLSNDFSELVPQQLVDNISKLFLKIHPDKDVEEGIDVVERLMYCNVGIKSGLAAVRQEDPELRYALSDLATKVLSSHTSVLEEYSSRHPAAHAFLQLKGNTIKDLLSGERGFLVE